MSTEGMARTPRSGLSGRAARLLDRAYWVSDSFREVRWLVRHLPIGPSDVVLDVGSGSGPNLRSNVLCDKFPWDGTERHGHRIRLDRPFVMGDVEQLPFADKAFDFVICSHVLEHVESPERAVAELQRVARRGYIETPSAAWEKVAGFDFHRWMVSAVDGRLVFVAKRHAVEDQALYDWFEKFRDALHARRYVWFRRRAAGVYTSLVWSEKIEIEVHPSDGPPAGGFRGARLATDEPAGDSRRSEDDASPRTGPAARVLDRYGRHLRRTSEISRDELDALLRCPACRGELHNAPENAYRCRACGSAYPSLGAPFPVLVRPPAIATAGSPHG